MSSDKVEVTNRITSVWDWVFWAWIGCVFAYMAGCDVCKGTSNSVQCLGKNLRGVHDDFLKGFKQGESK